MEKQEASHEVEESGLDALASAAVLGDYVGELVEPAAGATTKHPRHRAGCSCIVCIQPPSGKGKHKTTCACNVCVTVRRRFKTLMLRKKKRQTERKAEKVEVDGGDQERQKRMEGEVGETSNNGKIDLNCDPDGEEVEVEEKGVVRSGSLPDSSDRRIQRHSGESGEEDVVGERQRGRPPAAPSLTPLDCNYDQSATLQDTLQPLI